MTARTFHLALLVVVVALAGCAQESSAECEDDRDCRTGFGCHEGTCAPSCEQSSNCSGGAACIAGVCVVSICGNGVVESPESCDGNCPTSCTPGICQTAEVVGSAGACSAHCVVTTIDTCADGDGCCPLVCNETTDDDCVPGGDPSAGDPNPGDPHSGDPSIGDPFAGDPFVGDPFAGDPFAGDPFAGDPFAGDPFAGDPFTGDPVPFGDPIPSGDPIAPGDTGWPSGYLFLVGVWDYGNCAGGDHDMCPGLEYATSGTTTYSDGRCASGTVECTAMSGDGSCTAGLYEHRCL